jgi:hypothetical protein
MDKIPMDTHDKKWSFGFSGRANAKMCKELRIKKLEYYHIYHKNHILEKVIAVAITAYAFDGSPDNEGDGLARD